jgi:hypothetical protein
MLGRRNHPVASRWSDCTIDALWRDAAVRTISEPGLQALFCEQLLGSQPDLPPVNYAVLNLVPAPAVIFDFNLDGGMDAYCGRRHLVLAPHGTFDRRILEVSCQQELIDAVLHYEIPLTAISRVVLPGPEHHKITNGWPYQSAIEVFPRCPAMVIVGYSFGRWDGALDDLESFEFFVDLLKRSPKPVVVVSPEPEFLAGSLQDSVKSRKIYGCPIYWHKFAASVWRVVARHMGAVPSLLSLRAPIAEQYRRLLDGEPQNAVHHAVIE